MGCRSSGGPAWGHQRDRQCLRYPKDGSVDPTWKLPVRRAPPSPSLFRTPRGLRCWLRNGLAGPQLISVAGPLQGLSFAAAIQALTGGEARL